jgi:uncharacterized protein YdhG (YjbR/CyaY superfamily)
MPGLSVPIVAEVSHMTAKKAVKKGPTKPERPSPAAGKSSKVFTNEERAAMRERAKEMKAGASGDDERAVLEKISAMTCSERAMGERIHAIIKANVPELSPKLWYGMPAYAKEGKVVCFFQDARKFKTRYATFGFSDKAMLDDGDLWPTEFAVIKLTPSVEARIAELVKKAAG